MRGQTFVSICLLCFLNIALAAPADHFVTTWETDDPGTSNATSITVPMVGGPYDVDWDNDGAFDEFGLTGSITHDYGVTGTYKIRIRGVFDSIRFNNGGDKNKILSIDQWGTNSWTSMNAAFRGAANLQVPATDTPDFSAVTNMRQMFASAGAANPDTSGWDTSAVTTMQLMFYGADSANPDTSSWNTGEVTNMEWMFTHSDSANPDTSRWDTSAVTDMSLMFFDTNSANPDTSGWDTSAVTTMQMMFWQATSANPDTSGWDTAAVTDMSLMFINATSFDRDVGSWNITSLTNATNMFNGATLSTPNYDSLLIGWGSQLLNTGVPFHGGNSTYCTSDA